MSEGSARTLEFLYSPYHETKFRHFGTGVIRYLINNIEQESLTLSFVRGLDSHDEIQSDWFIDNTELRQNAMCCWARHCILAADATIDEARKWLDDGIASIPTIGTYDWRTWDEIYLGWLKREYLEYLSTGLCFANIDTPQWEKFWTELWIYYLVERNIQPAMVSNEVSHVIHDFVATRPQETAIWNVSDFLHECCDTANIQWNNVDQPTWALFHPMISWKEGPEVIGWDTPLIILVEILACVIDDKDIQRYVNQHWIHMIERLKMVLDRSPKEHWKFEFSFPIENHYLPVGAEVKLNDKVKLVGITAENIDQFQTASGVRPIPELNPGDLHMVVSMCAPNLQTAREHAMSSVGNAQALLRVADFLSRWDLSQVYFWSLTDLTGQLPDIGPKPTYLDRRDNYQLPRQIDPKRILEYSDLIQWLENEERELAKSLLIAMRWQGISRTQNGSENEFMCLWIALEKLGNGSYKYRDIIPKVAGTIWRLPLWNCIPKSLARLGIEQDQKTLLILVNSLAQIRNREVAHRGEFKSKKDKTYATWILRCLTNDLTEWFLHVLQTTDISSFEELCVFMDDIADSSGVQ